MVDQDLVRAPNKTTTHSKRQSGGTIPETTARYDRIAEMVAATVEVIAGTISAPALTLLVTDLVGLLPDDAIARALVRCRRELGPKNGFPPVLSLKDVLDRAEFISQAQVEEAEPRAAWDQVIAHADKWIVSDPWGGSGPRAYYGQKSEVPHLPRRVVDTVRRIGGWRAIKTMTSEDYPHVQRRFYEEYRSWAATEIAAGVQLTQLAEGTKFPCIRGELGARKK